MPRRLHQGRPGARVIPTGWAAAHRPTVATSWNGAVTIRNPDEDTGPAWSNELEQNVMTPAAAYYSGAARIQQLDSRADQTVVAADPESVADYLVVVDASTEAHEGHVVTVTEADDPVLQGRDLTILRVVAGTERFERDLLCTLVD